MRCKYETEACKNNVHCTTCSHYVEPEGIAVKPYRTNADRIRSMTDEELAKSRYVPCPYDDGFYSECKFGWHEPEQTCEECTLEWLRMPYKE